jgi:hypothetical protein
MNKPVIEAKADLNVRNRKISNPGGEQILFMYSNK